MRQESIHSKNFTLRILEWKNKPIRMGIFTGPDLKIIINSIILLVK